MDNSTKGLGEEQQRQLLFLMLVQQHEQIAAMGMGMIPNPATNKTETDLHSAKYAIDTLMMVQHFTKGNITGEMDEFLEQTLTRLRIDYARAVSAAREKDREKDREKKPQMSAEKKPEMSVKKESAEDGETGDDIKGEKPGEGGGISETPGNRQQEEPKSGEA
jgi:hypothetical protein